MPKTATGGKQPVFMKKRQKSGFVFQVRVVVGVFSCCVFLVFVFKKSWKKQIVGEGSPFFIKQRMQFGLGNAQQENVCLFIANFHENSNSKNTQHGRVHRSTKGVNSRWGTPPQTKGFMMLNLNHPFLQPCSDRIKKKRMEQPITRLFL